MTNAWIDWDGDACPVHPQQMVRVRFAAAGAFRPLVTEPLPAWTLRWERHGFDNDIVAYQLGPVIVHGSRPANDEQTTDHGEVCLEGEFA